MKKLLFALSICLASLTACEKNGITPPRQDKEYTVSFDATYFSQTQTTLSKNPGSVSEAGDTLKNHASYLYYYVYNESGDLVKSITQEEANPGFGTISDQLSPGTYTFVFIAAESSLTISSSKLSSLEIVGNKFVDIFVKKLPLTVTNSNVSQKVRLERKIAAIDVTIEDAFPNLSARLHLVISNDVSGYMVNTESARSLDKINAKHYVLNSTAKGQKFTIYTLNTFTPVELKLEAYDVNGRLTHSKQLSVPTQRNKRTQVSGRLFNLAEASFNIIINRTWETPFIVNL